VSWAISSSPSIPDDLSISLITHDAVEAGQEIFNNYGPKPNAELVLGYGFALPNNPDDTIVLRVGSSSSTSGKGTGSGTNEVGRKAVGAEAVLADVRRAIDASRPEDSEEESAEWESELDAAEALLDMVELASSALPANQGLVAGDGVRAEVATMLRYYIDGEALLEFGDMWLMILDRSTGDIC
jgi:hypothetical protein